MTYRRKKKLLMFTSLAAALIGLSACSTISEDTCMAGNWEAVGYKDGANGKASSRLEKVAEKCTKYGASVDNRAYWAGYDRGVVSYCTFQRGFERGENGGAYNQVCAGELSAEYAPGYEEGRARYAIKREHKQLVDRYYDKAEALHHVRARLNDRTLNLTDKERDRLRYKARRLEREMDDARYRVRQFERRYDLPRRRLDGRY